MQHGDAMPIFRRRRKNMFRDRKRERQNRIRLVTGLALCATLAVAFFVIMVNDPGNDSLVDVAAEEAVEAVKHADADVAAAEPVVVRQQDACAVDTVPMVDVVEEKIRRGQTASSLLSEFMSPAEIYDLNKRSKKVYPLSRMRAGRPYRIVTSDGQLQRFEYEISGDAMLVVAMGGAGWDVLKEPILYDTETKLVRGRIDSSLFGAVSEAGEKPALAVRLSEIFAWDIDFIRDIRKGDSFTAVVEKRFRDGEFAGYGKIEAARFVNQGDTFNGFLFADKNGREAYYDEKGRSLRKAFLKAPLNFSRISSGFNLRRLHPILKIRRPHPGIDYAAPRGTPVKAVGDGIIIRKGWDNGGGNYLKIRHNSVYETTYMHLRGFAKGMRKGKRVSQGQVIAYVGSTGMSTGPHLDFRMKRNGSYVNPRRIKSPSCAPVAKERMAEFNTIIEPLLARLDAGGSMHANASASVGTDAEVSSAQ